MKHQTNVSREMVERAVQAQNHVSEIAMQAPDLHGPKAAFEAWEARVHAAEVLRAAAAGDIIFMLAEEMGVDIGAARSHVEAMSERITQLTAYIKEHEGG